MALQSAPVLTAAPTFVAPDKVSLDACRRRTDPLADAAVAGYFATVNTDDHGALFAGLVRHTMIPPEDQVPAVAEFFAAAGKLPDWADVGAVARGQRFFNQFAAHHFSAMYLVSLPSAYAAAKGVQVLHMTARLRTDTERRLNETAQFLMDISAPGAFGPHGVAIDRILHIRLMHAAVRWLIANDPSVTQMSDEAPPMTNPDGLFWSESWGRPVNQEDLVGTLLTFTVTVYDMFDKSGVQYRDQEIIDHLHMWQVIGHLLGIEDDMLPATRAESAALRDLIWTRQHAPSASGRAMQEALLAQSNQHVPRFARPIMPAAFREFLGEEIANDIALPPNNWTRVFFGPMTAMTRVMTRGEARHPLRGWFSRNIGRWMLDAVLSEMRGGGRPDFAIPDHLANSLRR